MTKSAVYAGTFDPITNGHKDLVHRALGVFSRVHVAIGTGASKEALYSIEEREKLVVDALAEYGDRVAVHRFNCLLVDFVRNLGSSVIIRGLRTVADYDYEAQMALTNRQLAEDIETVFLVTSQNCSFISSSIVKDVAMHGGDVRGLVPGNVADSLEQIYAK